MSRIAPQVLVSALVASLAGCQSMGTMMQPAFARLDAAVVNDRYAGRPAAENVRIVRAGSVVSPSTGMRLAKGDSIITSRETRAVITFGAGYEVTLDTATAIYIENPSIFLRIGQAFIRKITGRARPDTARLDTHTPQATLHDAGTEYLVSVSGQGTDLRVVSGAVQASSRDGRWPGVTYTARERGRIDADRGAMPAQRLSDAQVEAQLAWVRRVERITRVPVPNVDGLTEAAARSALSRAGFSVLMVLHRETDAVAPGRVVEQSPAAGETAPPGSYVTLTLSKAGRTETCTVPDIVRKSERVALQLLQQARLSGQLVRRENNGATVVSQEIKAGSSVPCGTTVRYVAGVIIE